MLYKLIFHPLLAVKLGVTKNVRVKL